MNLYVAIEGDISCKEIYNSWIPLINPSLTPAPTLEEVGSNSFYVLSAGGYPEYFTILSRAIDEINESNKFDRLIVVVDSEDFTYQEKLQEMNEFFLGKTIQSSLHIVIQHFCLETWALGNKRCCPRNPENAELKKYKLFFDVLVNDPELLPPYRDEELNRAQFAYKYLRRMINDKHKNLTYTKNNTKFVQHPSYFSQIKLRLQADRHILSFQNFLDAFTP